ncbi:MULTISPECIES: hypothetical protein [unclassified Microcoleus]|nr:MULTISPECIES: hypothetical protein [unclassified Microcoleus]
MNRLILISTLNKQGFQLIICGKKSVSSIACLRINSSSLGWQTIVHLNCLFGAASEELLTPGLIISGCPISVPSEPIAFDEINLPITIYDRIVWQLVQYIKFRYNLHSVDLRKI